MATVVAQTHGEFVAGARKVRFVMRHSSNFRPPCRDWPRCGSPSIVERARLISLRCDVQCQNVHRPGCFCGMIAECKESMMKTITIMLATGLALSSCLSAAQGAHHGKRIRHSAARSVKAPTLPRTPFRDATSSCRTIPNMSSNNWFGVDNDVNVYRDRPQCN